MLKIKRINKKKSKRSLTNKNINVKFKIKKKR